MNDDGEIRQCNGLLLMGNIDKAQATATCTLDELDAGDATKSTKMPLSCSGVPCIIVPFLLHTPCTSWGSTTCIGSSSSPECDFLVQLEATLDLAIPQKRYPGSVILLLGHRAEAMPSTTPADW